LIFEPKSENSIPNLLGLFEESYSISITYALGMAFVYEFMIRSQWPDRQEVRVMLVSWKGRAAIFVCCIIALGSLALMGEALAADRVTIIGTVYEDDWDDNDNPTAVVIETREGEEYLVAAGGKGMELVKLGDQDVKATGTVTEDAEGFKTITVTEYEIVK
jgi:hypothetical protein